MGLFFRENDISIFNDDFLTMRTISDGSVDLIVTSPPYNLDIGYKSFNDGLSYVDYLALCRKWFEKCLKVAKHDGRFCLNIPLDKSKGGYKSVGADLTTIAKEVGWQYKTTIIWNEGNISKGSAWGSWLSASAPHIIAPVELIVVFYKHTWKKTSGSKVSDIEKYEFIDWTRGIWTFSGESKSKIGHPTPFPVELPYRCIKLLTYVGDTVLDPFMGSGSTLVACKRTGRIGIGVDIERDYCSIAKNRIINEQVE